MQTKRRVATALVAFSIAMGSGHFVQYGPTVHAGIAHFESRSEAGLGLKIASMFSAGDEVTLPDIERTETGLPKEPAIQLNSIRPQHKVLRRDVPGERVANLPMSDHDLNAFGIACTPMLTAETSETNTGLSRLTYNSPCRPNDRVEVSYSGLEFSYQSDQSGHLSVLVPVLSEGSAISLTDSEGNTHSAVPPSQAAGTVWRAALNWRGSAELSIHAYEFGARFGEPGHVSGTAANTNALGQIIRLGDPTLPNAAIAEVYGVPQLGDVPSGTIALVVEATVTQANCGRGIDARVWHLLDESALKPLDVSVAMPGCDAIGETLMLKNLMRDLKIAAK